MNERSHIETELRPWYREPWPWVLIAIPALTVIASGITLWLAISHPDPIVVDNDQYRRLQNDMRVQPQVQDEQTPARPAGEDD